MEENVDIAGGDPSGKTRCCKAAGGSLGYIDRLDMHIKYNKSSTE